MSDPTAIIHGSKRDIMAPHLTDAQVESGVFMCTPGVNPSELIKQMTSGTPEEKRNISFAMAMPQIGRDRLLYLSQKVERLEALLKRVNGDAPPMDLITDITNELLSPTTVPSVEPELMKRP